MSLHEASLASHRHARAGMLALCVLLGLPALGPGAENPKKPASGGPRVLAQASSTSNQPKYKPNEVLVRFRRGVSKASAEAIHLKVGAQVIRTYRTLEGLQLVRIPSDMAVDAAIAAYRKNPDVLYAEPNYAVKTFAIPNDPLFPDMWGLNNTGQNGGVVDADIDAPEAWDLSTGSSSVVVVDIDTGIDYNHEDLAANVWNNPGDCDNNGIDDDADGWIDDCHGINPIYFSGDPFDDNGHGTHTAGTIGAVGNNSIGVVGVNQSVTLAACKFLDTYGYGYTDGAVTCLDWVALMKDGGLNVVATNNSWGGGGFSQALLDAINANGQRGILFIAAAGNAALDNDAFPAYPANFLAPTLIAVAATDRYDGLAFFSDFGRHTVHVGAPGHEIWSTVPTSNPWCPGSSYCSISGTSMATPHVTGLAALLKAQDGTRDWRAIKNLILAGGDNNANLANTITQKRINAYGSMTCNNSTVFSRLQPAYNTLGGAPLAPITITALNINCANPNGNVPVTVNPGGQTVTLLDDGVFPDQAAADGVYAGQFVPPAVGTYTLTFPDQDVVTVNAVLNYSFTQNPFNWRAITGTSLGLFDEDTAPIVSPFPVQFGGQSFDTVYVGTNGALALANAYIPFFNDMIPTSMPPVPLAAPFWDDLWFPFGGADNVFWEAQGSAPNRELIVEWRNAYRWPCQQSYDSGVTFQIVLFENQSDVLFNYANTSFFGDCWWASLGATASVGIQSGPSGGTQFSFWSPSLSDSSSLLWTLTTSVILTPPSHDFGDVVVNTVSAPETITLSNVGTTPLNISGVSASSPFVIQSNTCGSVVPAAGSCDISLTFEPTVLGPQDGTLTINDDGIGNPHTAALHGRGVSLGLPGGLPQGMIFPDQPRGTTSAPATIVVTNTGTGPLGILSIATTGAGDFNQSNNCPASLPVSGTCNIDTTFTPVLVGARAGTLVFTHDGAGSPVVVQLSGNGLPFVHPQLEWRQLSSFYDPRTGSGVEGAAANVINGGIYVSHGYRYFDSAFLSFYDIVHDTWTHGGPDLPDAFFGRSYLGGGTANGKHYAMGGSLFFGEGGYVLDANEEFDPSTHTWMSKAPMPTAREIPAVASWNGKIYVIGGCDNCVSGQSGFVAFDVNEVYDPVSDTWTTLAPIPTLVAAASAVAWNGKIYVFGGAAPTGQPDIDALVLNLVQIYDVASNTWSSGTPMPLGVVAHGAGIIGGKIAIFGGIIDVNSENNLLPPVTASNLYDAVSDTWSPAPEMPVAAAGMAWGTTYDSSGVYSIGSLNIETRVNPQSTVQVLADRVTLSVRTVDFGAQRVGVGSSPMQVTLTNGMAVDLHISNIATTGDFGQSTDCLATLAADFSCNIWVTLTPTARGLRQGTLVITDDGFSSPRTVLLSGTGVAPVVSLSPTSLDFGDVDVGINSLTLFVILENTGDYVLNISSVVASGEFAALSSCPAALDPSPQDGPPIFCTLSVDFEPTSAGPQNGTVTLTSDAPDSPHVITLTGNGVGPVANLSPTSLAFADTTIGSSSTPQSVTVTNNGNVALAISNVGTTTGYSVANGCGTSVAPNTSCTLDVTFSPLAAGAVNGLLVIVDSAVGSPRVVSLSGNGIGPLPALAPLSLSFSSQVVATSSAAQTTTITNSGNRALSIASVVGTSEFSASHNCPSSLAPGGSCNVQVAFTPAAAGARSAAILINDNAYGSPHTLLVSGTGEDFAVGAPPGGSLSANIRAGDTATFNLNLSATSGFNGNVTLSCSGAPRLATCSASPNSVRLSGGRSATATVTVRTTARSMTSPVSGPPAAPTGLGRFVGWQWLLALLLLAMLATLAQKVEGRTRFALAAAMLFVLLWAACGGGMNQQVQTGTPPGTYTLTVTATYTSNAGTSTRSVPINLVVN